MNAPEAVNGLVVVTQGLSTFAYHTNYDALMRYGYAVAFRSASFAEREMDVGSLDRAFLLNQRALSLFFDLIEEETEPDRFYAPWGLALTLCRQFGHCERLLKELCNEFFSYVDEVGPDTTHREVDLWAGYSAANLGKEYTPQSRPLEWPTVVR